MEKMLERKSSKETEWEYRLARFAASGLFVNEFCQAEGISVANFYRWRKLLSRPVSSALATSAFMDVGTLPLGPETGPMPQEVPDMTAATLSIRLDLGHGLVLHIERR